MPLWCIRVKLQSCAKVDRVAVVDAKMAYQKALGYFVLIFLFCGILFYHRDLETEHSAKEPKSHSDRFSRAGEAERQGYNVRHCTTDSILGRAPKGLQTVPFEVPSRTSPEISKSRTSSFQRIFQNKVWIAAGERNKTSLASGKKISKTCHS